MKINQLLLKLLFLIMTTFSMAQTGVTVTYYNGSTQDFTVSTAGKLYFVNEDLYIKPDGTTTPTTIPVNIIRKITFSNALATTTFGENKFNRVLYPNPSAESIKISSDVEEDLDVKIYALSGQLIHQGQYQVNQPIDISQLTSGLYLVQVNGLTFKFSKK